MPALWCQKTAISVSGNMEQKGTKKKRGSNGKGTEGEKSIQQEGGKRETVRKRKENGYLSSAVTSSFAW